MLFIWAMKMEATVTNRAVPSMLTVAPMGRTNLEILVSTLLFSIQRNVIGRAAALNRNSSVRGQTDQLISDKIQETFVSNILPEME